MVDCTGQYVGPNLILTARHCGVDENDRPVNLRASSVRKARFDLTLISKGENDQRENDWALYRIDNPDAFSDRWFEVSQISPSNLSVIAVGFGGLRKLDDWEIPAIKDKYKVFLSAKRDEIIRAGFTDEDIRVMGETTLVRGDSEPRSRYNFEQNFDQWLEENPEAGSIWNRRHINPLFTDYGTLKIDPNCATSNVRRDGTIASNCQSWRVNSGGAIMNNGVIWGIIQGGVPAIGNDELHTNFVDPRKFFTSLKRVLDSRETWERHSRHQRN
jgi:hypothetical protein